MDVDSIREDFVVLQKEVNGKPIIYMDSACMSLKPLKVLEAINNYYMNFPSCAGRSNHTLSNQVEEERKKAREAIQKFIGADRSNEIIFTRNTTEGLNLVMSSLDFDEGDVILTTDREHNSNLIPCHMLAKSAGITHQVVKSGDDFTFDMDRFQQALSDKVKLVSFVYTSNLDGHTLPVKEIIKAAHDNGSMVMLDAAQAVPHHDVNVKKLDVDFLAFSGHKMLGPTGTGALYVKEELQGLLRPFMVGGETVEWSTYDDHKFLNPPERFEAGLQNYAGEIGFAAAARYISSVGKDNISWHEQKLTERLHEGLSSIKGVEIVGVQNPSLRGGITSFNVSGMGFHEVAMLLNENDNIMVRSGQHCVHSWFKAHEIEGSVRASLYLYNTEEEVDKMVSAIGEIAKLS